MIVVDIMEPERCSMCGAEIPTLLIGGCIHGQFIDFNNKNFSPPEEPSDFWFCVECWEKMREISER